MTKYSYQEKTLPNKMVLSKETTSGTSPVITWSIRPGISKFNLKEGWERYHCDNNSIIDWFV
jgi:hypothetical protein